MAVSPLGTITIDASGSTGIDFKAFIMGGFLDGTTLIPPPRFDNSPTAIEGEETFYNYGTAPTDKYVLTHGSFSYSLQTHQVTGEINRIEFGTRGTGSFDSNGYHVGGDVQLSINGLDITEQAIIQAISAVFFDGGDYEQADLDVLWETLSAYSQDFIGTSDVDTYTGTAFDDTFTGNGGDDVVDGGSGVDTAVFTGNRDDYEVTDNGDGTWTVVDERGPGFDGEDTLTGFEKLEFLDETMGIIPPVANNDTSVTLKNLARTITVLSNDSDSDGTLVNTTVTIVDGPDHGTVLVNADGTIKYTPDTNYLGTDSFTYTVTDNDGHVSNEATVSFNVVETLELTTGDDVFSGDTLQWTTQPIKVNGGDGHDYIVTSNQGSQPDTINGGDGNDLIFTGSGNDTVDGGDGDDIIHARSGTDTVSGGDGNDTFVIRFFRNVSAAATDTGTTTITDTDGVLWNGTFKPAAVPSAWTSQPGATAGFGIFGTATIVSPGVWNLAVLDDSAVPVTKNLTLNWTGGDLTITAGTQTTIIKNYVTGTFGITLEGVPNVDDDSGVTLKNQPRIIDVLANDDDPDGDLDATTVTIIDGPLNGDVSVDPVTGLITYAPDANFVGDDSFTYTVTDDDGVVSAPATVSLNIVETYELTSGDDVFSGDSLGWTAAPIIVDGGDGDDYFVTSNTAPLPQNDVINGGDGNDLIFTGRGDDVVDGGDGDDVIHARAGNDSVTGGEGDDTFVIRFTDAGTTTITDDDGVLFHGTFTPATIPAAWNQALNPSSGYLISGEATFVSDGVWNLEVTDNTNAGQNLTLAWTGGDLTVTKAGGAQTVVIKNYVRGTFGIELENSPPTDLELSGTTDLNGVPTVFVREDAAIGTVIGTVSADDLEGDDLTFEVEGAAADFFEVVGTELRVKAALDQEDLDSHVVTVKVTDEAGNETTRDFTVEVRDVLDEPEGTLTIDASALDSVNFSTFLASYFAGAGTGAATLSGGVPNETGDQIDIEFSVGDQEITIGGAFTDDEEAHGGNYGDGISGTLDSVKLGRTSGSSVIFDGFGIEAAAGSGSTSDNLLNRFYAALLSGNVAVIQSILAAYAQNFKGTAGSDQFVGSKFDDIIDGNGGLDFLVGGKGDDTYIVGDPDSVLVEKTGEGTDSVQSSVSFELWSNVENLELTGIDDVDATGNELANILLGNSGQNRLDGKAGADAMTGGDGDDTYVVDNAGDTVTEVDGEGEDTVEASVTFALGDFVEHLILTGTAAISGTGNAADNELTGNSAANTLNGRGGGDTMTGGGGGDTYVVDDVLDTVVEASGEGNDTVRSTLVNNTLATNVENLILLGVGNLRGTGNDLRNTLTGNAGKNVLLGLAQSDTLLGGAGNDTLNGGLGQDRLTGGANNDTFVFDVTLVGANRDTITDFNAANDRINLERDVFTRAGAIGQLKVAAFVLGTKAADASDRIVYNKANGALFYDTDGLGGAAQVQFATLANKPTISHLDFFVV